jgi:glucose/arabinose dehydrogenase
MDDDWAGCDAEAVVAALSVRHRFSRANALQLLRDQGILRPREEEGNADDWPACDAEAVVVSLSARYRFSRANALQLLRDEGIVQHLGGGDDDEDSEVEEGEAEEEGDGVIPMPGQDLVTVGTIAGTVGEWGFHDGPAAEAMFQSGVSAMVCLPDGRVLLADNENHRLRMLSADLQEVSTVAGDGEQGNRDGAAAHARFGNDDETQLCLALLPDGCVLVGDDENHRLRLLSADLQEVITVAGDGEQGYRDGAAAQAQFYWPQGLAVLPDGRVLVADCCNHRLRLLSADLQEVSTVAGDGEEAHRDGAAAQAQFNGPMGFALLPDGRVLVADSSNNRIRLLSADLQQVSTVAGDGEEGGRDGPVAQAQLDTPSNLLVLPDGRVLVIECHCQRIRVLSANLQEVSTLTNVDDLNLSIAALELLPDGRVLVSGGTCIKVLEGFPPTLVTAPKPAPKVPKDLLKRALAGGASSSSSGGGASPSGQSARKRGRSSGAGPSSAAAAAPTSIDSEDDEQLGGSAAAAEAQPLM